MLTDWVKQAVTAGGTGNLTLGSADSGFIDFNTGVGVGPRFTYSIEDGANREIGIGYLSAATTLVRQYVRETLVSGTYDNTTPSPITVTTAAKVTISATAQNLVQSFPRVWGTSAGQRRQLGNPAHHQTTFGTLAMTANILYVMPFLWRGGYPISTLYAEVTAAADTKNCRLALADIGADWATTTVLAQTGDVSVGGVGMISGAVTPLHLSPGWYLGMVVSDGTPTLRSMTTYDETPFGWHATSAPFKVTKMLVAKTYGTIGPTVDLSAASVTTSDSDATMFGMWAGE
ncbi:MAG: hypothetical protein WBK19_10520 [Azonexus sp.]